MLISDLAPLPGESAADHRARVAGLIASYNQEALVSVQALLTAQDEARKPLLPEPSPPDGSALAWAEALTAAERSAVRCPKAWALVREVLGGAVPSSWRRRGLSSAADKLTGATVLSALCAAAAAAESRIASVESGRIAGQLGRYFESAHPSKPVAESRRSRVALDHLRRRGSGLFNAIDAARVLFGETV